MRAPTMGTVGDGAFDVDTERADVGIGPYGVRSAKMRPTRLRTDGEKSPTADKMPRCHGLQASSGALTRL